MTILQVGLAQDKRRRDGGTEEGRTASYLGSEIMIPRTKIIDLVGSLRADGPTTPALEIGPERIVASVPR